MTMAPSRYLSAKEACAELGIRPQTLYAYVSRGLIRSETGISDSALASTTAKTSNVSAAIRNFGRVPKQLLSRP